MISLTLERIPTASLTLPEQQYNFRRLLLVPDSLVEMREMRLADVEIRINYFHDASDDDLHTLGVDRELLPTKEAWHSFYEEDYARPIQDRVNFSLVWELDGRAVGFRAV